MRVHTSTLIYDKTLGFADLLSLNQGRRGHRPVCDVPDQAVGRGRDRGGLPFRKGIETDESEDGRALHEDSRKRSKTPKNQRAAKGR